MGRLGGALVAHGAAVRGRGVDAAGVAGGEMGEDLVDDLGSLDTRDDAQRAATHITACLTVLMAPNCATFGKRTCDGHRRDKLMPMRPCSRLALLRCPATEATLDVADVADFAVATVPELPSAPHIHPELPRARLAARGVLLRWPLPAAQATIVPCPSPHDPRPRRRRASR